jgi:hypothetical protein
VKLLGGPEEEEDACCETLAYLYATLAFHSDTSTSHFVAFVTSPRPTPAGTEP